MNEQTKAGRKKEIEGLELGENWKECSFVLVNSIPHQKRLFSTYNISILVL